MLLGVVITNEANISPVCHHFTYGIDSHVKQHGKSQYSGIKIIITLSLIRSGRLCVSKHVNLGSYLQSQSLIHDRGNSVKT